MFAGKVVNVDHHPGNDRYGAVNLVDLPAAAVGEIVADLLDLLGWPVTPDVATNLWVSLVSDTGSFRYGNTTPKALALGARLVAAGARPAEVNEFLFEAQPLPDPEARGARPRDARAPRRRARRDGRAPEAVSRRERRLRRGDRGAREPCPGPPGRPRRRAPPRGRGRRGPLLAPLQGRGGRPRRRRAPRRGRAPQRRGLPRPGLDRVGEAAPRRRSSSRRPRTAGGRVTAPRPDGPSGILLVDKPERLTSHDVVDVARRLLDTRRVGHTGTLDPVATGLLVLCVGRAVRLQSFLTGVDKSYEGEMRFGVETDTYDRDGAPVGTPHPDPHGPPSRRSAPSAAAYTRRAPPDAAPLLRQEDRREEALRAGAKRRVGGDRAEERPGLGADDPRCGRATGPRSPSAAPPERTSASLVHDIGRDLGLGAHLVALRRTAVGPFRIEDAATLPALEALPAGGPDGRAPLDLPRGRPAPLSGGAGRSGRGRPGPARPRRSGEAPGGRGRRGLGPSPRGRRAPRPLPAGAARARGAGPREAENRSPGLTAAFDDPGGPS